MLSIGVRIILYGLQWIALYSGLQCGQFYEAILSRRLDIAVIDPLKRWQPT